MRVGDSAAVTRAFTAADVADYVELGGHPPPAGAVPEPLVGALWSYLLGVKLPGLGTNYLKQETEYLAAARVGDPLTARVTITRLRPDKHLVDLETVCADSAGTVVGRGRALVYVADVDAPMEA
ncbi:MAG TPA: hypothetical protein VEB20_00885 [Azospirillaceae bacterium]|nr:hypothetical protein [Azospirillaceae bacterium]